MNPSTVVVDASLAVPWALEERYTPAARALLLRWERRQVRRLAPCWFAGEVASALYRQVRGGVLTLEAAERVLAAILASVTLQSETVVIAIRALAIAQQLGQSRPYDCLYAALAEHEGCELWTADLRFYHAAHTAFPWIRFVDEASASTPAAIP